MRNLLSYAIGSNFGATVPPDTGGVFLFFTQLPVVVFPNPCTGCVVNVTSQSGTRNFTNPGQPYFWYHDRPTAMQGTIGTDTTSDVQWTFQAATFTPPDTAHTFNFVLLVNAMWPPPNETAWQVRYDGTQDSVPDAHGKPLWTKFTFQHGLGQDKWTTSGLEVSAGNGSKDINYSRIDSLGNMSAFMDVIVNVDNGDDVTPIAMFGFAEPTGGKAAVVTVTIDTAKFAQIDNTTGVWTTLTGSGVTPVIGTNTYRLRKFGQDSAVLCVNGARALAMPYASLETTGSILAPMSAFFGLQGVKGKGHATYTLLTYTIGSDGGACF
jgi:hypothetical protein